MVEESPATINLALFPSVPKLQQGKEGIVVTQNWFDERKEREKMRRSRNLRDAGSTTFLVPRIPEIR
jgi:hypothetical protein